MESAIRLVIQKGYNYVVNGHHRLAAAKRLGFEKVPVNKVSIPCNGYNGPLDFFNWG